MAHVISDSENLFGIRATWTWLEAGHGKGPCDGVGGALKKAADNIVKGDKAIRNSEELENELRGHGITMPFIHASSDLIEGIRAMLKGFSIKAVDGISSMHAFVGDGKQSKMRELPCFDKCCREDGTMTCNDKNWEPAYSKKKNQEKEGKKAQKYKEPPLTRKSVKVGSLVAISYEDACYQVGKVTKKIEEYYQISLMRQVVGVEGAFEWGPTRFILINFEEILLRLNTPKKVGRQYVISAKEVEVINSKLESFI